MTTLNEQFYEAIGYLFYAIADADKVIEKEEKLRIKEIIYSDWFLKSINTIDTTFDAAAQIHYHFEQAMLKSFNSEKAYQVFDIKYNNNRLLFTDSIKHDIWEAANLIAGSFSGKNKSELIWLTKLSLTLKS